MHLPYSCSTLNFYFVLYRHFDIRGGSLEVDTASIFYEDYIEISWWSNYKLKIRLTITKNWLKTRLTRDFLGSIYLLFILLQRLVDKWMKNNDDLQNVHSREEKTEKVSEQIITMKCH